MPSPRSPLTVTSYILLVAVGLLTLAGFAGRLSFWLDNLAAFRPALTLAAVLLLLATVFVPRRLAFFIGCVAVALTNIICMGSAVVTTASGDEGTGEVPDERRLDAEPSAQGLLVVTANILSTNADPTTLVHWLRELQPDVVVLQEVTPRLWAQLTPLLPELPHHLVEPRTDSFGIALLSRLPLAHTEIKTFGPAATSPSLVARVTLADGAAVTIVGVHALPPVNADAAGWRDGQARALAAFVDAATTQVIVVGDLNMTPWSRGFSPLRDQAALSSLRRDGNLMLTWPAHWPEPLRVPIDHILFTWHFRVEAAGLGPAIGSDHLPLWARLVIQTPL